jgi:N-acylneuraminate cytidylyltransferase
MPVHTAFEIDTPDDWEILATLVAAKKGQIHEKIGPFKLLVTDVDGVLTDAGMYYGPEGEALKKFNTRDGMGTAIWRESGRDIAIVTSENSQAVARRAEKLKIEELHLGVKDKLPLVRRLAETRGISMKEVAYMGDDLNDLEVMQQVGFAACPADAHPRIRGVSRLVTQAKGGEGCLRELVDWLLTELGRDDASHVAAAKAADT